MKKNYLTLVVLLSLLLVVGWQQPAHERTLAAANFTGCGGDFVPVVNEDFEQQIVYLTNLERVGRNLPPLKHVSDLDEASRYHAADLATDNYEAHETYDRVGGQLKFVCDTFERIGFYYTDWMVASENIAGGLTTPDAMVADWMDSPGHRANILDPDVWEIGAGYYYLASSTYKTYWVQEFGRRFNRYPVIINNEAADTDTPNVELYIYGEGEWQEMRLRNDGGDWSSWQPFQKRLNWTLPNTAGEHTVEVKLRSSSVEITSRDKITLTTGASLVTLGGLPQALTFFYSRQTGQLTPAAARLAPQDVSGGQTLTWQVSSDQSWLLVNPVQGASPNTFTVTPAGFDTSAPAIHSASLQVTVTAPAGALGSPQTIAVMVNVLDGAPGILYLPLAAK